MNDDTMGNLKTGGGSRGEDEKRASVALTIGDAVTEGGERNIVLEGRYRVVKRLGEGGMGSVWLAEDTKLDGRKVAIKMLPSVLAGKKGAYKQVKAEAMVAMKLAHPNIATVRAFEEDEGGNPFLVMDYIEGEGLDDILAERGPLSEEETLRLLGPVAAALDYAHGKGVVHRDVKPGNVIVAKDGTPYVLDFGIAREIQETMTRVTGKLSSGTLLYMSPEQLRGKSPTAAQDVYSFAAMAYECLAGHPPFFRGAIEDQIKNEPPEELSGSVGAALRKGVMAGLAKEASQRPAGCARVLGSKVEGQWSVVEGRWSKVGDDGRKGNNENRFADSENRRADSEKVGGVREGGRGDEEVFLRKVRVENGLKEAERGPMTEGERAELGRIQELWAAGAEALKNGARGDAGGLFAKAEGALGAWKAGVAARKARERAEAEARKKAEEELRQAEEEMRRAGVTMTIVLPGGAEMEMVWCPPGSYLMGTPKAEKGFQSWLSRLLLGPDRFNDETEHMVTLTKGFWLAKTQVTQAQWESVMGTSIWQQLDKGKGDSSWGIRGEGNDYPMYYVSWNECQEFCRKAGLALPTEAEWEYACRAGSTGEYGGTGRLDDMGWHSGNSGNETHPVGQKEANKWGFMDMHGNVWEWCEDEYADYPTDAVTDYCKINSISALGVRRVLRGGSWRSDALGCRSANRNWIPAGVRSSIVGFRPVCSAEIVQ